MVERRDDRPVTRDRQSSNLERGGWPETSLPLAEQLQQTLAIPERDWHALKGQKPRRAAVQMAAALVQLLARESADGRNGSSLRSEARQDCIALLENALGWLREELRDPGCPSHQR